MDFWDATWTDPSFKWIYLGLDMDLRLGSYGYYGSIFQVSWLGSYLSNLFSGQFLRDSSGFSIYQSLSKTYFPCPHFWEGVFDKGALWWHRKFQVPQVPCRGSYIYWLKKPAAVPGIDYAARVKCLGSLLRPWDPGSIDWLHSGVLAEFHALRDHRPLRPLASAEP